MGTNVTILTLSGLVSDPPALNLRTRSCSRQPRKQEGVFCPERMRGLRKEHLPGRSNWQFPLWSALMAQALREYWMAGNAWRAAARAMILQ